MTDEIHLLAEFNFNCVTPRRQIQLLTTRVLLEDGMSYVYRDPNIVRDDDFKVISSCVNETLPSNNELENCDETLLMASMGLPVSFTNYNRHRIDRSQVIARVSHSDSDRPKSSVEGLQVKEWSKRQMSGLAFALKMLSVDDQVKRGPDKTGEQEELVRQCVEPFDDFWKKHGDYFVTNDFSSSFGGQFSENSQEGVRFKTDRYWYYRNVYLNSHVPETVSISSDECCSDSELSIVSNSSQDMKSDGSSVAIGDVQNVPAQTDQLLKSEFDAKIERMNSTMMSCMDALRGHWTPVTSCNSSVKSVHVKMIDNKIRRRSQQLKKRRIRDTKNAQERNGQSKTQVPHDNDDPPLVNNPETEDIEDMRCAPKPDVALELDVEKYWCQRYRLFSAFDDGIMLDEESWFSVTPEKISMHHAERCRGDVVLDAMCGAGGNVIQLAFTCEHVIAVDIDPSKISLAQNNVSVYGVEDRIDFIACNFLHLKPFPVDCVIVSPPWGGPQYTGKEVFDCETMNPKLSVIMEHARKFSQNIAVFLPKNIDAQQIVSYCLPGEYVEIEQNYLSNKLKTVTVYFNDLVYFEDS